MDVRAEEIGHLRAQESGDDGRRGLARPQSEVVARTRDRHAKQVSVPGQTLHHCRHDHGKNLCGSGPLGELADVEEICAIVGAEGPVVVLDMLAWRLS